LGSCGADDNYQGKEDLENVSQGCSAIAFEKGPVGTASV
jgi:hypothetical protein